MSTPEEHRSDLTERQPTPADGMIGDLDVEASLIENSMADGTGDTSDLTVEPAAPEEITGRATGTDEDLTSLYRNPGDDHLADGFKGGSAPDESTA